MGSFDHPSPERNVLGISEYQGVLFKNKNRPEMVILLVFSINENNNHRIDMEKWPFTPTYLSPEDYIEKVYQNHVQSSLFSVKTWHKPGTKEKPPAK